MWIRSQDKSLLTEARFMRAEDHRVSKPTKKDPFNDEYVRTDIGSDFVLLGSYKTRDRALQVLDEIQGAIWESERAKIFPKDGYVAPVYTMPKS